jgi:hypothetical protein
MAIPTAILAPQQPFRWLPAVPQGDLTRGIEEIPISRDGKP